MDAMKKVLDHDRIRHKLAFWKAESREERSAGEAEPPVGATLTEKQIHELIRRSFDDQRAELTATLTKQRQDFREELTASIHDHLAEVSAPVERLYQSSLETQQQLLHCSQELRQEVARFTDDLAPRMDQLEGTVNGLGTTVEQLERATQTYVERFNEQLGELTDNLETTNHSLFALHKSTGDRIDDVLETHKADFESLWHQQAEAHAAPAGWQNMGTYCADGWRAVRSTLQKMTGRLSGGRQPAATPHQPAR
jgi:ferritin-like metal-binding protein YciE